MCRPKSASKEEGSSHPLHPSNSCPYTIRRLNSTTHLIREKDSFGEFPHIYAKLCTRIYHDGREVSVLIITDTGVGTTMSNPDHDNEPSVWNIHTFLEHTINPGNKMPYLIITSHCHYDHILGLKYLIPQGETASDSEKNKAHTTILSSSYAPSFIDSWDILNFHSLCENMNMPAPRYTIGIWANDHEKITYKHPSGAEIDLPVTILHTPGHTPDHTPDSLTWYDSEERWIYVGDSLYQRVSDETDSAPWGKEAPGPIMFTLEGNIADWFRSINKVLDFVRERNAETGKARVKLGAGHVTSEVGAESCLVGAKGFIARVLMNEVAQGHMAEARGKARGHWSEDVPERPGEVIGEFSVGAPLEVIEKGRRSVTV